LLNFKLTANKLGNVELDQYISYSTLKSSAMPSIAMPGGLARQSAGVERTGMKAMASILLVDDDDEFLAMLSGALMRAGHRVTVAFDGKQALKLYTKRPTDLVITDLVMPGKEGIELIGELKGLYPEVKIIAVSGAGINALGEYLDMAKMLGAQRVLSKPFSEEEILEAVREVLES
jgi:CheY-like chemotaxis protein